jgi:ribosome-associated protein
MAFEVPPEELEFKASRASGPGGQHVNTSATRVEVRWDVAASPSLTDAQRARLMERLGTRIDSRGVLRVVADERRSQARNREAGIERLQALVAEALKVPKPRKKTKPSRAAKQQRLADKRKRGERKRDRRTVDPDD